MEQKEVKPSIFITFSVDWEGENFHNLNDFLLLRKRLGKEIPFTHYICPTYFLKNAKRAKRKVLSAIFPNDEVALHIHCRRGLLKKAGIEKFITYPNFYRPFSPKVLKIKQKLPTFLQQLLDRTVSGRGVPISAYSDEDIRKIFTLSKQLLEDNLPNNKVVGFRCGGGFTNNSVYNILMEQNFLYDSSAVPPEIFSHGFNFEYIGNKIDEHGDKNGIFTDYMIKLWGYQPQEQLFLRNTFSLQATDGEAIHKTTQPFFVGSLLELPNNCGMSDFASSKTMLSVLQEAYERVKNGDTTPFILNTGCHQEGEPELKFGLLDFFRSIPEEILPHIQFITNYEAAKFFLKPT